MEELKAKLKNLDEKSLYGIFAAVLIVIFVSDFFLIMNRQINSIIKITPQIKTLTDDLAKAKDDIGKIDQYKKDVERLKAESEKALKRVKSKEELPVILEEISVIADRNKVKVDQIMPAVQDQQKITENKGSAYYRLPIEIEMRSSYHNFGRFINQLENAEVFLKVASFSMTHLESSTDNTVKLTVDAVVFEPVKVEEKKK